MEDSKIVNGLPSCDGDTIDHFKQKIKMLESIIATDRTEKEELNCKNQELQDKTTNLGKVIRMLQSELKNVFAEKDDLLKNNRELNKKLGNETTLSINTGIQNLELEKNLQVARDNNMKLTTKFGEMNMEMAILKETMKEVEINAKERMKEEIEKHHDEIKAVKSDAAVEVKKVSDEKKDLAHKMKALQENLVQSNRDAQKYMDDVKRIEDNWSKYMEQRNEVLIIIKDEMAEIEKMTKSRFYLKKRPTTRREKIRNVCSQLDARLEASLA